jgi:hypothetical protein
LLPHCHSERSAQHEVKNLSVSFSPERLGSALRMMACFVVSSLRSFTSPGGSFRMTVLFVASSLSF